MAKNKKPKRERSDIPYAERLRMKKLEHIAEHRDDAHLIELKLSLVSLNEALGLGCIRLSQYAKVQQQNREKFYADHEYERVKLDQAVRQLGFIVEDGRLIAALGEEGKVIPAKKQEVRNGD